MKVYVAWSVDHLEGLTAAALMSDNVEELRRISGDIRRASENLKAWAMATGGSPILDLNLLGVVQVPPDKMPELPEIAQRFRDISEGSISVGVGMSLSESYVAMKHSQKGGGDRISLYDPSMEEHDEPAPQDPAAALQSLGKADGQNQQQPEDPTSQVAGYADSPSDFGLDDSQIYADSQPQQSEPQEPPAVSASAPATSASMDSGGAPAAQPQQPQDGQQQEGEQEDPRTVVVQALQKIKQQAPVLEQMKASNPEAFEAVKSVVAAMILMAQGMAAEADDDKGGYVQKSEPSDLVEYLEADGHEHEWGKDEAGGYCLKCGSDQKTIELAKAGLPMPDATPKRIVHPWPVGTVKEGKVKVAHVDPATNAQTGTGWKEVRAGMVTAPDGHPTSSRNPNGD